MGVWIETLGYNLRYWQWKVTPCVGVWIETLLTRKFTMIFSVTPCVGVWIETYNLRSQYSEISVTPCVGVWIETVMYDETPDGDLMSHPAWVCGLKQLTGLQTKACG